MGRRTFEIGPYQTFKRPTTGVTSPGLESTMTIGVDALLLALVLAGRSNVLIKNLDLASANAEINLRDLQR